VYRWIALPVAVALATAGLGTPALADDATAVERAQRIASEAQSLAQAGDYLGAAARYKSALAIDPRPEYDCNVGIAYWKARDLPRAQLFLSDCSSRASHLAESFVTSMRQVLDAVETRLRDGDFAPVDVSVDPETAKVEVSSFAPDDTFVGRRIVWLPFGTHALTATATGHEAISQDVTIDSRDPIEVRLELPAIPPPPPEIVREPAPPPEIIVQRAPPSRVPAYTATALTIAALVTDVLLYGSASNSAAAAGRLEPGPDYATAYDLARARRDQLYAMYAVTGGCAAVTTYLWWRVRRSARHDVTVSAGRDHATISVGGRF
jgi:hypothetical protein